MEIVSVVVIGFITLFLGAIVGAISSGDNSIEKTEKEIRILMMKERQTRTEMLALDLKTKIDSLEEYLEIDYHCGGEYRKK